MRLPDPPCAAAERHPNNLMRDKAWKESQISTSKVLQTKIVAHDQVLVRSHLVTSV
jgi:hypothetical protein